MMIGVGLRRFDIVGRKGTDNLSRIVIYYLFPVLVFYRIALTENPSEIITEYFIHIWAVIIIFGSGIIGVVCHRVMKTNADIRTFIFAVAFPNWIFLPLAIAGPLWGESADRLIILFNIPTQVILWTAGLWLLRGSVKGMHALRCVLLNPGLVATAVGILVALELIPVSLADGGAGLSLAAIRPILGVIGRFTIPLSIVVLGLYLGERMDTRVGAKREVLLVSIGRLLVAPVILIALVMGAALLGMPIPHLTRCVLYLIISMPVAMSVPVFVQLFGGDRFLASRSIVVSTVASFLISPILVIAALKLDVWLGLSNSMMPQ